MQRRFVIAGTNSGVGKTTLTLGIMAALKKRGMVVQGFKCGPDYIDPTYHNAITGRYSRNLDSWMLEKDIVHDIFVEASFDADLSIIEGVMGLYDGRGPDSNEGSTAEISRILDAPVLLVVNITSVARSAAAIVKGYQLFDSSVKIAGVIVNQAGSIGHYQLCKSAIEQECGIPVVGYLREGDVPEIPDRHLGLIPAIEHGELNHFFEQVGEVIAKQIDLDAILKISEQKPLQKKTALFTQKEKQQVTIAVAYDSAFHFYYQENLKLLELAGARLVYFRPVMGEKLPEEADGLYLGGGFPEEFAHLLARYSEQKRELKEKIENGLPVFAECGGFMYLTESIITTNGDEFPMVGIIPGKAIMQSQLAAIGYQEVTALHDSVILHKGERARGHEFHYSIFVPNGRFMELYHSERYGNEGFFLPNVAAGYIHLHFASNQKIAKRFVDACKQYQMLKRRDQ